MAGWRVIALGLLVLVPVRAGAEETPQAKGAEDGVLRTWAVLSTPEVRNSGLEDLVVAGLASDDAIRLVDREHLDRIARELGLGDLMASAGTRHRRETGEAAKADALLLLSQESVDGQTSLRLVVCESRRGARLRTEALPLRHGGNKAAAEAIIRAVTQTRKHFAKGVRRIVGIAPFVSKTLTHEYDHLQRGYSTLLAEALGMQPGVAVIEVEEARQVMREVALTDGKEIDRTVPAFVDGEFRVSDSASDGASDSASDGGPVVAFVVRVHRAGSASPEALRGTVPLAEAGRYLATEMTARLLETPAVGRAAFSAEEQAHWLAERADALALLGNWQHAVGLREAALLLKPESVNQRLKLLDEYLRLTESPLAELSLEDYHDLDSPKVRAAVMCRVESHLAGLAHLEYLIRNHQISASQAIKLFSRRTTYSLVNSVRFLRDGRTGYRMGEAELKLAEDAQRRFLTEVYPQILSVSKRNPAEGRRAPFDLVVAWNRLLFEAAFRRVDRTHRTKEDLDWAYRVLTELSREDVPLERGLTQFFRHEKTPSTKRDLHPDTYKEGQWVDFLKRLRKSDHRIARLYARYGLLWNAIRCEPKEPADAILREVDALLKDVKSTPYGGKTTTRRTAEWMYRDLLQLRRQLARGTRPPEKRPSSILSEMRPPGWEKDPEMWKRYGYPKTMGRLRFTEIEARAETLSGKTAPLKGMRWRGRFGTGGFRHWRQCTPDLDVIWGYGAVLTMHRKDMAKEILVDPRVCFSDVQYDGENLWVATLYEGLWLVSTDGEVIEKIGPERGLPPSNRGILIHPIDKGKVFAVGSFGTDKRAWCAVVSTAGTGPKVHVFHEATHVQPRWRSAPDSPDPKVVFIPKWVHEYHGPPESPRTLLIGRYWTSREAERYPLAIRLDTLEVSAFPHNLGGADLFSTHSYYSRDGEILRASLYSVSHWAGPNRKWPDGKAWKHGCKSVTGTGLLEGFLLLHDGWLYAPGSCWYRLSPETYEEEMLVPGRLPNKYSLHYFAVSAHYGLIGLGPGLFQVTVAEPADGATGDGATGDGAKPGGSENAADRSTGRPRDGEETVSEDEKQERE